jgi:V8-like Glu-specific endopeptidase
MHGTRLRFTRLRIIALLALLMTGTFGMGHIASAQTADESAVVSSAQDGVNVAAPREWTADEMRAAISYQVPTAKGILTPMPADLAKPDGPAGAIEGTPPTLAIKPGDGASPDSSEVGNYSQYPFSAVGKVFFTQYGRNYVCSAAIVKDRSIWTAGHCVHAGNNRSDGWSTNVVFVPQYRDGSAPLGQCAVSNLTTSSDWYRNGNPNGLDNDYAGGQISCNVVGTTGKLGFAYNQSYTQNYNAVGYPAGSPFDGGNMISCPSGLARYGFGSPTTYGIVCDMTGGSSGGPYIINNGLLNGNVSYGNSNEPGILYSPYFGSGAKGLYDRLP